MPKKVIFIICKCICKAIHICIKCLKVPSTYHHNTISSKDLAEWKRIEGIDQYIRKRN